jgi:hypothetical protein
MLLSISWLITSCGVACNCQFRCYAQIFGELHQRRAQRWTTCQEGDGVARRSHAAAMHRWLSCINEVLLTPNPNP